MSKTAVKRTIAKASENTNSIKQIEVDDILYNINLLPTTETTITTLSVTGGISTDSISSINGNTPVSISSLSSNTIYVGSIESNNKALNNYNLSIKSDSIELKKRPLKEFTISSDGYFCIDTRSNTNTESEIAWNNNGSIYKGTMPRKTGTFCLVTGWDAKTGILKLN